MQTYSPFRHELLTSEELAALYVINVNNVVRDTLLQWMLIAFAWAIVVFFPNWWVIALSVFFIGTRIYALFIIAHDGLHRRLFKTVKSNDLWNDLFILGTFGTITRLNRTNHMQHHHELACPTDPDRYKYTLHGRARRCEFLLSLTCVPLLLKSIFIVMSAKSASPAEDKIDVGGANRRKKFGQYRLRDIAIILGWQVILILGLSVAIGWWAYPFLWFIPVSFALCCDILRVFCEHSQLTNDEDADRSIRLVSFDANFFERALFAPYNMNYHITHHLWPAIPYYNLRKADDIVRSRAGQDSRLTWRSSYFGHIFSYWRWLGSGGERAPL